ncbi:MAG: UDP-N-acetylmuramate dehydrogenase, partial [Chromatiales bacterium]|nr:UDP-N-acetylmuramate dehydrogenase [Chromatiales bacterium]
MNAQSKLLVGDDLRCNEPLNKCNVWAVGGAAERLYRPANEDALAAYLASRPLEEPRFWLGLGSNLLIRDGGIEGSVLALSGVLDDLYLLESGRVFVGAGAPCPKVARFLARHGLAGGEFLAGIPGTMGGALAMNAGAHGMETWPLVHRVRAIRPNGDRQWLTSDQFSIGYRSVTAPFELAFLGCELACLPERPEILGANIKDLLAHRSATQPVGQRSCGSVFRNPPNDYAGRLIEAAGFKGERCGAAVVSEKHANFIVNEGGVTALQLETLIERIQGGVFERYSVQL